MKLVWLNIFVLLALISCSTEESGFQLEATELISLFEEEALQRGIALDVASQHVTAEFDYNGLGASIGQCRTYSDGSRIIVIDGHYWSTAEDLEKEFLFFHELGHCVLNREHDNSKDFRGFCSSIMQSGTGDCNHRYNDANRTSLLDELFEN